MVMELDDYKGKQSIYKALECFLHNHSKAYQVMPDNIEYLETYLELMQIILGSKPLKGSNICTVAIPTLSPLSIKRINCEILIRACEYELPIVTTTCPMAGTTAPYSRDSIILELLVESLAVGFLSQLLNKGNPFMLTGGTSTSNLMTGHDMYYTMEKFQTKMVIAQVGQNLNIPTVTECGGNMTGRYDMQSGAENMLMMLSGFMSGGILAGVGSAYNANGLSAENILIGLSFLDAVKYITDELTLDNLDECIESFKKQGHGGDFLTDDLTLQNIRSNEFFQNELFDYFAEFKKEKSMLEKAHEKAISIRNNFESKVPEKTKYELSKYIKKKIGSL
jgi:trimethylamine:corrinoid methyltransferase-like protein